MPKIPKHGRVGGTAPADDLPTIGRPGPSRRPVVPQGPDDAKLFSEAKAPAAPGGGQASWVALQAGGARAVPTKQIDRHLKAILRHSQYSDDRRKEWASTPDEVRRHPDFVKKLLVEDYHLPEWVEAKGDGPALAAVLEDPAFVAEQSQAIIALAPLLGDAVLADPRVKATIRGRIEGYGSNYEKLPATLREDPIYIEAAVVASWRMVEHVPAEALDEAVLGKLEALALKKVEGGDFENVPDFIRARDGFVQASLRLHPGVWIHATEDERAALAPLYDEPEVKAAAIPFYTQRFDRAMYSKRKQTWRESPTPLRSDADFQRACLFISTETAELAGLDREAVGALLTPAHLTDLEPWRVFDLAKRADPATALRADVRAKLIAQIEDRGRDLEGLPTEVMKAPDVFSSLLEHAPRSLGRHLSLAELDGKGQARLLDAVARSLTDRRDRADWSDVPEPLEGNQRLAERVLRRAPDTTLPPALADAVSHVYDDDGVRARAVECALKRWDGAYSESSRDAVWQTLHPRIAEDRAFLKGALRASSYTVRLATSPTQQRTVQSLLRDADFLSASGYALRSLAEHVPEPVLTQPKVLEAFVEQLTEHPDLLRKLPAALSTHVECMKAALTAAPRYAAYVDMPPPEDPRHRIVVDAWAAYAAKDASWGDVPESLRADPGFVRDAVRARPRLIADLSEAELELAAPLFGDPAFLTELGDNLERVLGQLPEAQLSDPGVLDATKQWLQTSAWKYRKLPDGLRGNPEVILAALEAQPNLLVEIDEAALTADLRPAMEAAALACIDDRAYHWKKLPQALRADPDFVGRALRATPSVMSELSEADRVVAQPVLDDPQFFADNVRSAFTLARLLSPERLTAPDVRDLLVAKVEEHGNSYSQLPEALQADPGAVVAYVRYQHGVRDVPEHLITDEVIERLLEHSPKLWSGLDRGRIPDALFARAETALIGTFDGRTSLNDLPGLFRDSLPVRKALLTKNGLSGLWGASSEQRMDPALWVDAEPEAVVDLMDRYPDSFPELSDAWRSHPEVASKALSRADKGDRDEVRAAVDPTLWRKAAFVDAMMAEDPAWFASAAPRLRANPARAKVAIQHHPRHIADARVSKDDLRDILDALEMPTTSYGQGGWADEHRLRDFRQGYEKSPDLSYPRFAAWAVTAEPALAAQLPAALAADADFFADAVAEAPDVLGSWPFERLDDGVRAAHFEHLRTRTRDDPSLFRHLPTALRNEPDLLADIIDQAPHEIRHAGAEAKTDATWRRAVAQDATLAALRGGAFVQETLPMLIEQLEGRQVAPEAIAKSQYQASDAVPAAAIAGWGGHAISMFKSWLGTPKVDRAVLDLLVRDPDRAVDGLSKVPAELSRVLLGAPKDAVRRFAIRLVSIRPSLAGQLPRPIAMDPEVRAAIHDNEPRATDIVALPDEASRVRAIRRNPGVLPELPPDLVTPAVAVAAVESQGDLLRTLSPTLQDDPEVVLAAVTNHGQALAWASERLRQDSTMVEAAIRAHPEAIRHSKVTGPAARDLELLAVRTGGLIDGLVHRLGDADFVLAFAIYCEDARYKGKVSLKDNVYRFEHLLDEPAFADDLVDAMPSLLDHLPEEIRTPERLFRAALRSETFWSSGWGRDKDNIEALRNLPVEQWGDLAKAYPRRFVSAFTKEALLEAKPDAVRAGVLEAIGEDHTALDQIPKAWWSDAGFMADAVDANPLAWRHFGPARQLWLQTLQPEAAARAERFNAHLDAADIKVSRFDGQFSVLRQVIQHRFDPDPADDRPVAVVVFPKDDHNGAFDRMKVGELSKGYRLMYFEAGSVEALGHALHTGTEAGPAEVVVLSGHGSPDSLTLGPNHQRPDVKSRLRPEHLELLGQMVPPERLADEAKIIFDACSVGGGGAHRRNLAVRMEDIWPHTFVQAAWFASSSGNRLRLDANDKLERMDFRDSRTLRPVPYVMVRPRTKLGAGPRGAAPRRGPPRPRET